MIPTAINLKKLSEGNLIPDHYRHEVKVKDGKKAFSADEDENSFEQNGLFFQLASSHQDIFSSFNFFSDARIGRRSEYFPLLLFPFTVRHIRIAKVNEVEK